MSQEKERVRQVSGEPRGCAGEPKQDPDRGAESTERPLLPQGRVAAGARWRWARDGSGSSTERDSRTKTALTVFVFLLTQACRVPVNPKTRSSRSYLVVFTCRDSSVLRTLPAVLCTERSRPMRRGGGGSVGRTAPVQSRGIRPGLGSQQVPQRSDAQTHAGPPAAAAWQRHRVYLTTSPGSFMLQVWC